MDESIENELKKMSKLLPGIFVCLIIAVPSWFLGRGFPIIGAPVVSILIGIICTIIFPSLTSHTLFGTISLDAGIKYTTKKLLQYSIVLLGFEMNLFKVAQVGGQSIFTLVFVLATAFAVAYIIGRFLKLPSNTVTLIGVGTAICGGSAIAATAPIINAKHEDVARSISTIFLFNVAAILIFPTLGRIAGMSDLSFGMWAGMAINDTSSVVAAGTSWSNAAGNNTALHFATLVKLIRTLMIIPVTLFLAIYVSRKQKRANAVEFNFAKVFPWFVVFFVVAAVINTFAQIPSEVTREMASVGKFVIVMAMAGIGLSTNLKSLLANGIKPILLGLCCWVSVAAVSIIILSIFNTLL